MKISHYWKAILPIPIIAGFAAVWLVWPSVTYRIAIHRLSGASSGGDWCFFLNTYSDDISSAQVAQFYLNGCGRLADLAPQRKTYRYQDLEGYGGCVTVIQHATSYEFVNVFGANDNDSISIGRAPGMFPPTRYLKVTQIPAGELPPGIIRPW